MCSGCEMHLYSKLCSGCVTFHQLAINNPLQKRKQPSFLDDLLCARYHAAEYVYNSFNHYYSPKQRGFFIYLSIYIYMYVSFYLFNHSHFAEYQKLSKHVNSHLVHYTLCCIIYINMGRYPASQ